MKLSIALTIPFWNVHKSEKERSENIGYCMKSLNKYAKWHNERSKNTKLDIILCNMGEEVHPLYPEARFYQHTGLKYRFEKPTRMNTLFLDLDEYKFVGMCDPDLIVLESNYERLFETLEYELDLDVMLTYSFVRTKPELRELISTSDFETQHLENHPLILEANRYSEAWGICGGIFFMGREAFIKVGGFNEEYRVYGMDDVDFTNRFLLNDYIVKKFPEVLFHHLFHPRTLENSDEAELERYKQELTYWYINKKNFEEQIEIPKSDRLVRNHISERFLELAKRDENFLEHEVKFTTDLTKFDLTRFPEKFQRQIGILKDDPNKFYG
ncbi:gp170 [Sphingomonas phage PAU]|uniref:gp170 n=1 Tax=Sphingomonas phage PAU TaxID=1150991 RepID=UPI00025732F6|nr:gp170 [Sphingomonas phage PAU]AFF28168.1 gp170 [Sphingomonas phage PAU]